MKWKNIKESVPSHEDDVLVTNQRNVWIGSYYKDLKRWSLMYNGAPPFSSNDITHWMEMPDPIDGYAKHNS